MAGGFLKEGGSLLDYHTPFSSMRVASGSTGPASYPPPCSPRRENLVLRREIARPREVWLIWSCSLFVPRKNRNDMYVYVRGQQTIPSEAKKLLCLICHNRAQWKERSNRLDLFGFLDILSGLLAGAPFPAPRYPYPA